MIYPFQRGQRSCGQSLCLFLPETVCTEGIVNGSYAVLACRTWIPETTDCLRHTQGGFDATSDPTFQRRLTLDQPENFNGAKGAGGMATEGTGAVHAQGLGQGWKISPSVRIAAGETLTIADIEGPGNIEQIWMTPTGNWRFSILRIYWDDQEQPSVEVPLGDFFACGLGRILPGLFIWQSVSIRVARSIATGRCPFANAVA